MFSVFLDADVIRGQWMTMHRSFTPDGFLNRRKSLHSPWKCAYSGEWRSGTSYLGRGRLERYESADHL